MRIPYLRLSRRIRRNGQVKDQDVQRVQLIVKAPRVHQDLVQSALHKLRFSLRVLNERRFSEEVQAEIIADQPAIFSKEGYAGFEVDTRRIVIGSLHSLQMWLHHSCVRKI